MAVKKRLFPFLLTLIYLATPSSHAFAQQKEDPSPAEVPKKLTLVQAAMCEEIRDHGPKNQSIVFPIAIGGVYCFTSFDPVPEKTLIYHKWYFRDKLRARVKLSLQIPRWKTFSRIRLRNGEKGPWRVEITDKEGNILRILRFSITD